MITAAAMLFGAAAVMPASAEGEPVVPDKVLETGDYEVVVDGKIDEGYLQSYSIKHVWPEDPSDYWMSGIFGTEDYEYIDAEGNPVKEVYGAEGSNFREYDWENGIEATSHFLWNAEYNLLYVAVEVLDSSVTGMDDEHYAMAVETGVNDEGPWLTDGITVCMKYGNDRDGYLSFLARADALGHAAYLSLGSTNGFVEWNRWANGHEENKEEGLCEVDYIYNEGGSEKIGYVVEMAFPVSPNVQESLMQDGGEFVYGITVCDVPLDFHYGLDWGKLADNIYAEGFNINDFVLFNDVNTVDNGPKYEVVLSADTVTVEDTSDTADTGDTSDTSDTGDGSDTGDSSDVPGPVIVGDINGDNSVDARDLSYLMKLLADDKGIDDPECANADVNDDGNINAIDLTVLMKLIADAE